MIDVTVLRQDGRVLWPPEEVSVPVCALSKADSSSLANWHAQWDAFVATRASAAVELARRIDVLLEAGKRIGSGGSRGGGGPVGAAGDAVATNGASAENGNGHAAEGEGATPPAAPPPTSAKEVVRELTELYTELEEAQRELGELSELEAPLAAAGVDDSASRRCSAASNALPRSRASADEERSLCAASLGVGRLPQEAGQARGAPSAPFVQVHEMMRLACVGG